MNRNLLLASVAILFAFCPACKSEKETADIFHAAGLGSIMELKRLIKENPRMINALNPGGETAIHVAIKYGKLKAVETLLESGANPNAQTRTGGDTPLHYAIMFGETRIVSEVLRFKPDLDIANKDGKRPIDFATDQQGDEAAKILDLIRVASDGC